MTIFPAHFSQEVAQVNGQSIAYTRGGEGPPVLLLHGFPQTRVMWHKIAPQLAEQFTVVAPDLRGYGASSKPEAVAEYSFRKMADDPRALMRSLGFDHFHLVGHDRGARTAHRLALDTPDAVQSLTVMDIIPTHLLLNELNHPVARAYFHWFYLALPAPFPEEMIGRDPDHFFETCPTGWGSAALSDFEAAALTAYRQAWRDPDAIRGMCHDYRAAIDYDLALDAADLGRQLEVPALVMWGADGVMGQLYDVPGTWADRLHNIQAAPIPGGHFFPDTAPEETANALLAFLNSV